MNTTTDIYNIVRPKHYTEMFETSDFVSALMGMTIENAPHALLFYGDSGCGKTTAARVYARFLNDIDDSMTDNEMINHGYIIEINAADNRKIDDVRNVLDKIHSSFVTFDNSKIVYIFNEVHQFTQDAQKAFLELFDILHGNVYIVFTTTNAEMLRPELANRFEKYRFHPLGMNDTYALVTDIYKKLELDPPAKTSNVIKQIYDYSAGIPRVICTLVSKYIKTGSLTESDLMIVNSAYGETNIDDKIVNVMNDFFANKKGKDIINKFKNIIFTYSIESIRINILNYINNKYLLRFDNLRNGATELDYITRMAECVANFKSSENEYINKSAFISVITRMLIIRYEYNNIIKESSNGGSYE